MEYLQYNPAAIIDKDGSVSFKPYYKWNTFNTKFIMSYTIYYKGFKPYYKWNTFNTKNKDSINCFKELLSFKPYYKWNTFNTVGRRFKNDRTKVLNLIINGIPSIHYGYNKINAVVESSFKPYYKWNTFNTLDLYKDIDFVVS